MKPREVSAGPLPLTRPQHGPDLTCSISLTCQMKYSAMPSTPVLDAALDGPLTSVVSRAGVGIRQQRCRQLSQGM